MYRRLYYFLVYISPTIDYMNCSLVYTFLVVDTFGNLYISCFYTFFLVYTFPVGYPFHVVFTFFV